MDNLTTVSAIVKDVLTEDPATRDSDNLLFYVVCKRILAKQGEDIDTMTFGRLFLSLKGYGLPQFESVGRCRRKLQHEFPELQCSPKVAMSRALSMDTFSDYGREGE